MARSHCLQQTILINQRKLWPIFHKLMGLEYQIMQK